MNPTTETEMIKPGSLARLVSRFRAMVEVRSEVATELRKRGDIGTALVMEAKSDAYKSACRELQRVMNGEIPPDPYSEWPETANAELCNRASITQD